MTNRFLVSVAAIALIAGASAANAQGGMNREGGGAATQQSASPSSGSSTGGATTQKSTEPSGPSGMKSTQSEQQKTPGAAKGKQAEENAPGQKSKSMSSENEPKGAAKDMKAEGREGRDANTTQRTDERSQTTTGQAGAAAKLSTEQRTQITTVIRNEHVTPVTNVDFQISLGTRVPRERISLRPLPAQVITIYPQWRGYEFFLVRDQIIVVDPRTLEIVAVLPA